VTSLNNNNVYKYPDFPTQLLLLFVFSNSQNNNIRLITMNIHSLTYNFTYHKNIYISNIS